MFLKFTSDDNQKGSQADQVRENDAEMRQWERWASPPFRVWTLHTAPEIWTGWSPERANKILLIKYAAWSKNFKAITWKLWLTFFIEHSARHRSVSSISSKITAWKRKSTFTPEVQKANTLHTKLVEYLI